MATNSNQLCPVRADSLYPSEVLMQHAGLGRTSLREARRNGLRCYYLSGRLFVFGEDWMAYVREHGKSAKDA